MSELGFRARKILFAIVTEYVRSGEPVGSRVLARRYGLNLSPASIRSVMADLEEAGLLAQPHTSAGRIPTDRGFRSFVDALVEVQELPDQERRAIQERLELRGARTDEVVREAGKTLAALTGAAVVVQVPRPAEEHLVQLRFIPLASDRVLAVLVSRSGAVENRSVPVARVPEAAELERVHNYLNGLLGSRTLADLREHVCHQAKRELSELERTSSAMVDATVSAEQSTRELHIEGQGLLLRQPDFSDVERMRAVLEALEAKTQLLELLDRTLASEGVKVWIGAETHFDQAADLSVISSPYRQAGAHTGTLGVIAPTRVDYQKVVPMVGFTARMLSDMLSGERSGEN